ncbi:cytochrome c-type biogenesis protein CcmF, mitochondrion, partial [Tanacetum coccineum]
SRNSCRENEAEIYARIRSLQSRDYYNLPPQNNPGEYEGLVRDHLDQALNVPHYRNILDMEYFELTVLERKGLLQDRLFNLMLGEQNLSRIMELSPYTNIRREAYDFLEGKVEPVGSLQHSFQRDIMDGSLNFFIHDIKQSGRNSQIYHYDDVFAPVTRIEAIRLFLAYASFKDFVVYQMDVKSAFLYGKIEEEVYVCQPPGFEDPEFSDKVYKVEKALYGLH